jgi:large subunit ribosomal protein L24
MAIQQFSTKLKKGDEVIVIAGKDKGKSGRITRIVSATNRVLVEGINTVRKHVTARAAMAKQTEPGIINHPLPIAASNLMLKDPKTGKPTRIGYKLEDGAKVRVAKASGTVLDTISKKGGSKAKSPSTKSEAKPAAKKTNAKSKE